MQLTVTKTNKFLCHIIRRIDSQTVIKTPSFCLKKERDIIFAFFDGFLRGFYIKACTIKANRFERILWQLLWFFKVTLFVSYPSISYPCAYHQQATLHMSICILCEFHIWCIYMLYNKCMNKSRMCYSVTEILCMSLYSFIGPSFVAPVKFETLLFLLKLVRKMHYTKK